MVENYALNSDRNAAEISVGGANSNYQEVFQDAYYPQAVKLADNLSEPARQYYAKPNSATTQQLDNYYGFKPLVPQLDNRVIQPNTQSSPVDGSSKFIQMQDLQRVDKSIRDRIFDPKLYPVNKKLTILFVLDCSRSMYNPDAYTGENRISSALDMVKNVCGALPADINVGFRVFGESPVWHPENPFPRCMASEQLILPGPLGSDHQRYNVFTRLMDERVRPGDGTPIPFAIEETLQDASMVDGPVSVIFLTDGSSTCGDPRTDVDFSKVSTNIDFHAYGFKLNRQAENEMRGVAEKLNGHFHQTNNRDLTKQVKEDLNNVMQGTVMPSAGYNFKNTETTPEGKPSK